jgi:hypothetical protein
MSRLNQINPYTILLILLIGSAIPFAGAIALVLTETDILTGTGDADKYYTPAFRLLKTGMYGFAADENGPYRPYLDILPVYPVFIALMFKVFGMGNLIAIAFVQALMHGATTVSMALSARAFRTNWMWPAAILTAIWPNLAYRPTAIMNETIFVFFLAWGICALMWVSKGRRVLLLLTFAGICFGMAYMTRPVLLLFPIVVAPALIYLVKRDLGFNIVKATGLASIPFVIMLLFTVPPYIQSYNAYGSAKFTIQRGYNALFFLYPCLSTDWGCGTRDSRYVAIAKKRYDEELEKLTDNEKKDVILTDELRESIAGELISEMPFQTFLKGVVGSTLKSIMHNMSYEVMRRFDYPPIHFGDMKQQGILGRISEFASAIMANPLMWIWAIFQIGLFASRGIQVAGLLALRSSDDRARIILLISMITAIVAVSVGFGSVRYRVPIEPELILLTIAGWSSLKEYIIRKRVK